MALVPGANRTKPLYRCQRGYYTSIWLRCLILGVFYPGATRNATAEENDGHAPVDQSYMVEMYNEKPHAFPNVGCVKHVPCGSHSVRPTPSPQAAVQQVTCIKPCGSSGLEAGVSPSGLPRTTSSNGDGNSTSERFSIKKILESRSSSKRAVAAASDVALLHSGRTRSEGNQTLTDRDVHPSHVVSSPSNHEGKAADDVSLSASAQSLTEPVNTLERNEDREVENRSAFNPPTEKMAPDTLSKGRAQRAPPAQNTIAFLLSTAARRMQHPVGTMRAAVMQQAIGQGAGVSALHQRAAILQRQNLLHLQTLPLMAGHRQVSPDLLQPAGMGRLDMYRHNRIDWLSGMPNIGIY